ncbi:hypothetical protein Tco_1316484 [Tanacetum coccineum]
MVLATTPLLGFSGEISWPLGQISLMVTPGDEKHSANALINFMVVRSPSPYNGIIGRPGLRKIQAVPFTAHGMLKFLMEGGIMTIRECNIDDTYKHYYNTAEIQLSEPYPAPSQPHNNTRGMQDGDQSTRPQPAQGASGHRKNQSSNPPRVSRPNRHDRRKPIRKRKNGTL